MVVERDNYKTSEDSSQKSDECSKQEKEAEELIELPWKPPCANAIFEKHEEHNEEEEGSPMKPRREDSVTGNGKEKGAEDRNDRNDPPKSEASAPENLIGQSREREVKPVDKTSDRSREVAGPKQKKIEPLPTRDFKSTGNKKPVKKQESLPASKLIEKFEKMQNESDEKSVRGMGNKYRSKRHPPIRLFDFSYEEEKLERERKARSEQSDKIKGTAVLSGQLDNIKSAVMSDAYETRKADKKKKRFKNRNREMDLVCCVIS